jgi:hypothetical protein
VKSLLALYYFNWAGTSEEFKEFAGRVKSLIDGVEGINLVGIFFPTSEWHCVMVTNATSYEKTLQVFKTYLEKYGRPKTSLGKVELFHTSEELPFL